MFSDLSGVRAALKARLAPSLPDGWEISEFIKQAPTEYRSPQVIFEFTRFDSTVNGQDLGRGQVAALVDLVIGSPMSAEDEGEDDVDQLALTLVQEIDAQSDMFWDNAEKQRLTSMGQWVWRIHTTVLTESTPVTPELKEQ